MHQEALFSLAVRAAIKAGREILRVYNSDYNIEIKEDSSPLTDADKAAHKAISEVLAESEIPVLSEEGRSILFEERSRWPRFWLVDPLDGTKEFIRRNGEFTVNIALMENNVPVLGVIHVPVKDILYAADGEQLYKLMDASVRELQDPVNWQSYRLKREGMPDAGHIRVLASRSHRSPETEDFITDLKSKYTQVEILSSGSALKFCLLAEGSADVYPRFGPTMEWDTAAGHIILKTAGKNILAYPGGEELVYNKPKLLNDWFIAR